MIHNQTILYKFIQVNTNINWYYISYQYILSENFIREFQNMVNWPNISYDQKLSEDFIREFKNKVNWIIISKNQTLSENFISEFNKYYINNII